MSALGLRNRNHALNPSLAGRAAGTCQAVVRAIPATTGNRRRRWFAPGRSSGRRSRCHRTLQSSTRPRWWRSGPRPRPACLYDRLTSYAAADDCRSPQACRPGCCRRCRDPDQKIRKLLWPSSEFPKRKTPGSCLPGVLLSVSSLSGSEVTLSANVQEHSALVPELVEGGRLRSRRRQNGSACELLVEEERADFSRERQVLDGSPTGDHTNLGNVVVGVASIVRSHDLAEVEARAELTLGGEDVEGVTVVANRSVTAPEAGRPVGIPVVVERTTDTKGFGQLEVAGKDRR